MKKYFIYSEGNYISGGSYWFRQFLQSILIFAFGIGLWLQGVTIYTRAKSLGYSNLTAGIYVGVMQFGLIASLVANAALGAGAKVDGPLGFMLFLAIVATIMHWDLWFSNGKKKA